MEFYAHAYESRNGKIKIRGVKVIFDATTINKYYNLPNIPEEQDEYIEITKEPNYRLIIGTLTDGQVEWKITKGVHKGFPTKYLTFTHRLWQYFVCAKIYPTAHYSTMDTKRAIMLYVISQRLWMDIGVVIYYRIMHAARVTGVCYLFLSLITALCIQAGVPIGNDEVRRSPSPKFTFIYLQKLHSGPKGLGQRSRPNRAPRASQASTYVPLSTSSQPFELDSLQSMRDQMSRMMD